MQQPFILDDSSEAPKTSSRESWISAGVAVFAIGAAAVLCVESFAEADMSIERVHSPSTRATEVSVGNR